MTGLKNTGPERVAEICVAANCVGFHLVLFTYTDHDHPRCLSGDHSSWYMEFLQAGK